MSLLSENSVTIFEATDGLYAGSIQTNLMKGKVSVANALVQVPAAGLVGGNAIYTVPLTMVVPKGAVVVRVIFVVTETFVTSGANTISMGLNTLTDLSTAVALNTWVNNAVVANVPDFAAANNYSVLQLQVQGAGSLTDGTLTAKVFFIN